MTNITNITLRKEKKIRSENQRIRINAFLYIYISIKFK